MLIRQAWLTALDPSILNFLHISGYLCSTVGGPAFAYLQTSALDRQGMRTPGMFS